MTKDEALKMAIEAMCDFDYDKRLEAINACKKALEQPAQEPVAYMAIDEINGDYMLEKEKDDGIEWTPLYTHPHQWQGLTDDEIRHCLYNLNTQDFLQFARAIEQALRNKNG